MIFQLQPNHVRAFGKPEEVQALYRVSSTGENTVNDEPKVGELIALWGGQRVQLVRTPTDLEWSPDGPTMIGSVGDCASVLGEPFIDVATHNGLVDVLHCGEITKWPLTCIDTFRKGTPNTTHPDRRMQRCGGYVRLIRYSPYDPDNGKTGHVRYRSSFYASYYIIEPENGAHCVNWHMNECEPCDPLVLPTHHRTIKIGDSVRYTAIPSRGHERGTVGRVVDLPPSPGDGFWIDVAGAVCCWFSHHFEPCGATGDK